MSFNEMEKFFTEYQMELKIKRFKSYDNNLQST